MSTLFLPPVEHLELLDAQLARLEVARAFGPQRLAEAVERALRAIDAASVRVSGLDARFLAARALGCAPERFVADLLTKAVEATALEPLPRAVMLAVLERAPEELAVWLVAVAGHRLPRALPLPTVLRRRFLVLATLEFADRYPTRADLDTTPDDAVEARPQDDGKASARSGPRPATVRPLSA